MVSLLHVAAWPSPTVLPPALGPRRLRAPTPTAELPLDSAGERHAKATLGRRDTGRIPIGNHLDTRVSPRRSFASSGIRLRGNGSLLRSLAEAGNQRAGVVSHSSNSSLTRSNLVDDLKEEFFKEVEGIDRGIFGVRSEKKTVLENIIAEIEKYNPLENPTDHLDKVDGKWKLLYSTISISGSKKTKLGLREFIKLSNFYQIIDTKKNSAVNIIEFNVSGITFFRGQLSILASYKINKSNRVDIKFESSTITPDQLYALFQKNYNLLLNIFNPEGWLDITYVDDDFRIGRDDKGNIFVVERCKE